jgi:hypothetical protein
MTPQKLVDFSARFFEFEHAAENTSIGGLVF